MFSIVFIVACVAVVNAHNWVNSPSRSVQANTVSPALPSSTGQPHVQVIAGQPFQIEWVQGHGRDVWFVFVAAADHKKMALHTSKYMDAYLDEAGATKSAIPAKYEKYHRKYKTTSLENGGTNNYFKRHVPESDANHITRDATFKGSFSGAPKNRPAVEDVDQFQYPDDCKKDDRRSFHKSANAPHIIGMHRYRICVHNPSRPDVALFEFPKGTKPGKYIVHYRWSGYYDAIDVQIVAGTTPIKNPYGVPLPPGAPPPLAVFKRIDHCEFLEPDFRGPCMRITTNEKACKWQCSRLTEFQCDGINVVSLKNRDTVYKGFRNITNIKFDDNANKCKLSELQKGEPVTEDSKICYFVKARAPTDIAPDYYTTDDPDDPAFYSTCWKRVPPVTFDNAAPADEEEVKPKFLFGNKCIDCAQALANTDGNRTAIWPLKDGNCMNCDIVPESSIKVQPPKVDVTKPPARSGERKGRCDGMFGSYQFARPCPKDSRGRDVNCQVRIYSLGQNIDVDVMEHDVQVLVRTKYKDICSNHISYLAKSQPKPGANGVAFAFCSKKAPACCNTCKIRDEKSSYIQYTLPGNAPF